jgi:hypothetical protein
MNEGEKSEKLSAAKFPKMGTIHTPETAKRNETTPGIKTFTQPMLLNIFSSKISNEL